MTLHNTSRTPPTALIWSILTCSFWGHPTGFLVKFRRTGKPSGSSWTISIWKAKSLRFYGMERPARLRQWFLDALGMLHDKLALKALNLSYWPRRLQFTSNKPVIADGQLFVGGAGWKRTSTIVSDERIRAGVNKFSAKWPNTPRLKAFTRCTFHSRRNRVYGFPSVLTYYRLL